MHAIRMDHPGKNALGSDLVAWLGAELERAGDEPILLTGTGDAFCAGLDLKELAAADAAEIASLLAGLDGLCRRLFEHPAPTAAWVNGHAIAGGCVLVQCCDYRVAEDGERMRIGLNEVALGACYPPGILRLLRHRLPRRSQHDLLLGANLLAPPAALAAGLLDAASMDAEADARAWLERASRHPRRTYAHTKRLLVAGVAEPSAADLERFRRDELPLWTSEEVRERVRAVLARG